MPSRDNDVTMERPHVELIDGKVLCDGRSLLAWASRVTDRIVERCDVSRIVLYGSVARGDDGPDSDIDLLVVTPIVGRRHDTSVRILNELRDLPVPVDITVVDPAHLDEEASVPGIVRSAMSEGRVLAAVLNDATRARRSKATAVIGQALDVVHPRLSHVERHA